jgi:hypothetical protein
MAVRASLDGMSTRNVPVPPPQDEPDPTPEFVRDQLLGAQERRGPAIRATCLQQYGNARAPGPLHLFVRERRLFALQLYLLLMCIARKDPWDATLSASTWALALDRINKSAEGTVSRNWSWLEDKNLIETKRKHRRLCVTRRREDGSDEAYKRPNGNFFIFPLEFFREGWHRKLELPGTAVLLIALHLSRKAPWFELRTETHSKWYGVSPDVLVDGIDELREYELLVSNLRKVRDLKARFSVTHVNDYLLRAPFAHTDPS